MSWNTERAREYLNDSRSESRTKYALTPLRYAMLKILDHLEESQAAAMPSETPSSVATPMRAAIKVTSRTSRKWSFPVNHTGSLQSSQTRDILDWLSSLWTVGDGLEVEIGVTLTSKVPTPPDGSPSPSTEAPTPAASGVAGEHAFKGNSVGECSECGLGILAPQHSRPAPDTAASGEETR